MMSPTPSSKSNTPDNGSADRMRDLYFAVRESLDLHEVHAMEQVLDSVLSGVLDHLAQEEATDRALDVRIEAGAPYQEAVDQIFEADRYDLLNDAVSEAVGQDHIQDRITGLRETVVGALYRVSAEVADSICSDCCGVVGDHHTCAEEVTESKEVSSSKSTGALHVVP